MGLSQLETHAWDLHRLVLDHGVWRQAWELIEWCLRAYQGKPDDTSAACNIFVGKSVPAGGWCKVWAAKPA